MTILKYVATTDALTLSGFKTRLLLWHHSLVVVDVCVFYFIVGVVFG